MLEPHSILSVKFLILLEINNSQNMQLHFYIYILANWNRKIIYVGVTNNISRRLNEHIPGKIAGFTKKYNCKNLVYYEEFDYVNNAIQREKEIKGWRREKKDKLVNSFNPEWKSLNHRFIREK